MIAVLQVEIPGPRQGVEAQLQNLFGAADPTAINSTIFRGKPTPVGLFHQYRKANDYVGLFMHNGTRTTPDGGHRQLIDVHIEDSAGEIFAWADDTWQNIKTLNIGASRTTLVRADVRCPRTAKTVSSGNLRSFFKILLSRSDFSVPLVSGVIAGLAALIVFSLIPGGQRPALLWALLPILVTALATAVVAVYFASQRRIHWSLKT
jgi:hypothetical protein